VCPICRVPVNSIGLAKEHYGSKHPKEVFPADNIGLLK
jgi:hypothetical protein